MPKEKILIAVKTYPTLSTKYEELVCTAGFREDGSWVRVYPIPFRKLEYASQYKKYEWIEIDVVKNSSDFRKESFRPWSHDAHPLVIGSIGTENNWQERKNIVLKNVYNDLQLLIDEAKDENICTSLAVFKPTKIVDFYYKPCKREWDKDKIKEIQLKKQQVSLFEQVSNVINFVNKLPYEFRYIFQDINGKKSDLMIEDWETGALYWNCLKSYGDEKIACEKVKEKYLNDFAKTKDLHFFLGTVLSNHARNYTNPFIIIGTFHPKLAQKSNQTTLFNI